MRTPGFDEEFHKRLALRGIRRVSAPSSSGMVDDPGLPSEALTIAEQRMWTVHQMNPQSTVHAIGIVWWFDDAIDPERLAKAVSAAVREFSVLTSTIAVTADNTPCWQAQDDIPPIRVWNDSSPAVEPGHRASDLASTPFDLTTEVPWRAEVIPRAGGAAAVAFVVHHIAVDDDSWAALLRRITDYYHDPRTRPSLSTNVRKHYRPRTAVTDRAAAAAARVWADPPPRVFPRTSEGNPEVGARVQRAVDRSLAAKVATIAKQSGASMFSALVAACTVAVHAATGATDLALVTPVVSRPDDAKDQVGYFGNLVPLRIAFAPSVPLGSLLSAITATCYDALEFRSVDLDLLRAGLRERSIDYRAPEILVALRHNPGRLGNLNGTPVRANSVSNGTSQFVLGITIETGPNSDDMTVELDYRLTHLSPPTANALADLVVATLGALANAVDRSIDDVVTSFAGGPRPPFTDGGTQESREDTVPEIIRQQCINHPNGTALEIGDITVTYGQLGDYVHRLARRLRRTESPHAPIALLCEPGLAQIVGLLATWSAGITCIPLDPAYPTKWIDRVLHTAGARTVLVDPTNWDRIDALTWSGQHIDPMDAAVASNDGESEHWSVIPDTHAYIGTTSGSTGSPKLIAISHRNVAARVRWGAKYWPLRAGETRLAKSSINFVDGITEIIDTLTAGATLRVLTRSDRSDPAVLGKAIDESGIQHLMAVPTVWESLAHQNPTALRGLTRAVTTGSAPTAGLLTDLQRLVPGSVHSSYGCAEVVGDVMEGLVGRGDPTTAIGTLPTDCTVYVLDARLRPTHPGVTGMVYIAGPSVAHGYLGDPAATASAFVAEPFRVGSRMFATGDRARRAADGTVTYLGRNDNRIKINGVRIERDEIESALCAEHSVSAAAVATDATRNGTSILVGYVSGDKDMDCTDIARAATRALPPGVTVALVLQLPSLPTLPSGKIDYNALPKVTPPTTPVKVPNPLEQALTVIVAEVLNMDTVHPSDDLFALGSTSLQTVDIARRAKDLGISCTAADLFEYRTVADLVTHCTNTERPQSHVDESVASDIALPLPPISRWWSTAKASEPLVVVRTSPHRPDTIRAIVAELAVDNEALRTRIFRSRRGTIRARLTTEPLVAVTDHGNASNLADLAKAAVTQDGHPGCSIAVNNDGYIAVAAPPQLLDHGSIARLIDALNTNSPQTGTPGPPSLSAWLAAPEMETNGIDLDVLLIDRPRHFDSGGPHEHTARDGIAGFHNADRARYASTLARAVELKFGRTVAVDLEWAPSGSDVPLLGPLSDLVPAENSAISPAAAYAGIRAAWNDRAGRRKVNTAPVADVCILFGSRSADAYPHPIVVTVDDEVTVSLTAHARESIEPARLLQAWRGVLASSTDSDMSSRASCA
ncbi:hypothetical protein DBV08_04100 [Rhodococcus sp. KBW08]|uniref:amino acid adenylation domain-containing protein n=1 Tax=Rhodococcus sp. KBW08 TaxID=2144188 RepID=UPI000F596036|nr:amino acid adenylation domain-containing protein [Rhodococcus sp. KBW08]RQO51199.1 hypothetical protein DBV08_04100 [Rhodococcus sp. KBW08]